LWVGVPAFRCGGTGLGRHIPVIHVGPTLATSFRDSTPFFFFIYLFRFSGLFLFFHFDFFRRFFFFPEGLGKVFREIGVFKVGPGREGGESGKGFSGPTVRGEKLDGDPTSLWRKASGGGGPRVFFFFFFCFFFFVCFTVFVLERGGAAPPARVTEPAKTAHKINRRRPTTCNNTLPPNRADIPTGAGPP